MLAPEVTLDSLLTPNELAARLKVSRFWIYEKLRRRDGFPHFRCGRYLRFSWPAVLAWLTAGSLESLTDFKQWCSKVYHRDPWQEQSECVEVWLEKRTLIPLVEDVTRKFDVMLRASAGNFSRTFLHQAAQHLGGINVPFTILY